MDIREIFKHIELKPFKSNITGQDVPVQNQLGIINKLRRKVNSYDNYSDALKDINNEKFLSNYEKDVLDHIFGDHKFTGNGENTFYQNQNQSNNKNNNNQNNNNKQNNNKRTHNQETDSKQGSVPSHKHQFKTKEPENKQKPKKPHKRYPSGTSLLNKNNILDSWYETQKRLDEREQNGAHLSNVHNNLNLLNDHRNRKSAFQRRNDYLKYDKDGNVLHNKRGKVKTYGKVSRKLINFSNNAENTNIAKVISYIILHFKRIIWSIIFGAITIIVTLMLLNISGIIHTIGHSPFEYCSSDETKDIQNSDDDLVGGINMKHPTQKDIDKFLTIKITDTFGISDSKAESWFLGTGCHSVRHFGLNKSNIHEVTEILHKYKISPIYFYMYAKEENGGAGGFINNGSADVSGGYKGNAEHDAKLLWELSKDHSKPISWVDAGNPADIVPHDIQEKGNEDFKKIKDGTIGRAYMKATASAAWGWRYKKALTIAKGGPYANPWTDMMSILTSLGGTPGATSDIDSMSGTCEDADSDGSINGIGKIGDNPNSLASKAAQWILDKKHWNDKTYQGNPGINIDGVNHAQCVDLSIAYFKQITKSNTLLHGNGNSIIDENISLYKKYGWKVIHNPKASDLKVGAIVQLEGTQDDLGHTEVIASLDSKGNMKMLSQNPESPCYLDAKYDDGKIDMIPWGPKWNMPLSAIAIPPASALK